MRFPGSSLHRPTALATARLLFIGEGTGRTGGGNRKPEDMPMEIVTNFGDPRFRVYDKATGDVVWEMELPAGTTGAIMTYMHRGTQYIVAPIGSTDHPPEFLALSLP